MKEISKKLLNLSSLPDHKTYHPEGSVLNHIRIVTLRALLVSGHPDLILAGLFHDICKGDAGAMTDNGWSNPAHAEQAADFVQGDEARYFIRQHGGNIDTVTGLCRFHMACKDAICRKAKSVRFIETFVAIDDMIGRKTYPQSVCDIFIPSMGKFKAAEIFFVGQSPIQQGRPNMTVTANRVPFTFPIKDAHIFFTGRWAEVGGLLK